MGISTKFTKREWFTLCTIGSVHFASSCCVSIQAPFYPQEAESKGASATEYGFVFGIFELVAFISSPIFGKYMDNMGAKFVLNTGMLVAGLSSMLFGMLDLIDSHTWFISLSFIIRIVESLGASAAVTASFSITAVVFPDSVATTFAALEMMYGLGYIVGPTIGGYLFQVGGFTLPFVTMGAFLMVDGIFIYFGLPALNIGDNKDRPQAQIFSMFKIPPVSLAMFSVTAASIGVGYYAATLEPHLRQFGLSPVAIGGIFVINGCVYALTAPLVGRLCDSRVCPKKIIILGGLLVIISYLLVGPAPFTPLPTTLWMCCVGLVIHGLGYASIAIPAFIDAIRSAVAYGLPDDITTYGIVSGLWASSFALGAFIGPSAAGFLYDTVGFRQGSLFVITINAFLIVAMSIFVCMGRYRTKRWTQVNIESSSEMGCANLIASWTQESDEDIRNANVSPLVNTCNGLKKKGYGSLTTHKITAETHFLRCES